MAITWGRSNIGGGITVGGSSWARSQPATTGRVQGASTVAPAPRPVVRQSTAPAPQQSYQTPMQDYSAGVDMGGMPDVDSIYAPMEAYLSQVENQLKADLPTYQKEAEANFTKNKSSLDTSKQKTLGDVALQEQQGARKYEDAMTSARRLFNEQQMGVNQRFGGASSAGEAGRAILGQEQQRQMGSNQRANIDFVSQINKQKGDIEQEYSTNLLSLEQQKQQAMSQIQRDFTSKLMEIANNRAQIGSAKAQARVQALMDYRNKVFAVQMQNMQFKQALDAQMAQSLGSLQQAGGAFGQSLQRSQQAQGSFNPSSGVALQQSYNNPASSTNPYVGMIGRSVGKGREEELRGTGGNLIFGRSMPSY